MTLASGCIVADPPQYRDPLQTPPVLDLYLANPSTQKVLVARSHDTLHFLVPLRSEDAGDPLLVDFYQDSSINYNHIIPSSTFNDLGREVDVPWTAVGSPGCHVLTLTVVHVGNSSDPMRARNDTAIATWWLNLDPDESMQTTLSNCPTPAALVP